MHMGYWPSMRSTCRWLDIGQVLFCVFMESRSINTQKNITRPISNHLDRTNLVKCGLYTSVYGIWDKTPNMINFPCRTEPVYRAGMIFPSQPATQSQHEIQFILPAHGASHIIKYNNDRQELAIIPYFHSWQDLLDIWFVLVANVCNGPFYSCLLSDLAFQRQRGWRWPCFDIDLTAFVVYIKLF